MAGVFLSRVLPLIVVLLGIGGCHRAFFHPQREYVVTPAALGLDYRDVWFESSDGVMLYGWLLPASSDPVGTVLFLHGNAENISTHIRSVAWLPAEGFTVFLFDYRGYGASQGRPSIEGIHRDTARAIDYLVETKHVDPYRLVVFGQSLGGAVAIRTAAMGRYRCRISAVVAEGAFAGYRQIVREKLAGFLPTWPLQWLAYLTISDAFSPEAAIAKVAPTPVLLVHGDADSIVPVNHARRLYQTAREPKQLWVVPEAGHLKAFADGTYRKQLVEYLMPHLQRKPSGAGDKRFCSMSPPD